MGKPIRYTSEFKKQTVQKYLQGDLSANQLALNLGIHPHTVRQWIKDYHNKTTPPPAFNNNPSDIPSLISRWQMERPSSVDLGMIITKINGLEAELSDLKTILSTYLYR